MRGRAARFRRVRWADAGWFGPRGRLGCKAVLSLPLIFLLIEKKLERRKEREG